MSRALDSRDLPGSLRRAAGEQDGQALVEFALVLPLLLVLLLGIVDFGRALNYWNDANQLAGEGARYAAVNHLPAGGGTLQAYLATQASPELANGSSAVTRATVCIDTPAGSGVGNPVHVKVTSSFSLIPFLASKIKVLSIPISGDASMRIEQVPSAIAMGCV